MILENDQSCDPYINCSFNYEPVCANNLHDYSNECQMSKYACQSKINLTKLHDGLCYPHEQERLRQGCFLYLKIYFFKKMFYLACQTYICLNGKTCMIENEREVCRCLFNCSSEENKVKIRSRKSLKESCCLCRYVDRMEFYIEIYAN